jgi:hypothetical protein
MARQEFLQILRDVVGEMVRANKRAGENSLSITG